MTTYAKRKLKYSRNENKKFAPLRWMGPIRNPRWEQKWTEGYTLSYLVDDMSKIRQVLFKVGMSKQRSSKLLTTIAYPSRASEFTIWFLEVSYCYIFRFLCSVVDHCFICYFTFALYFPCSIYRPWYRSSLWYLQTFLEE